jgi:hypothetical protein
VASSGFKWLSIGFQMAFKWLWIGFQMAFARGDLADSCGKMGSFRGISFLVLGSWFLVLGS